MKPPHILALEKHLGVSLTETQNPGDILDWEKSKIYRLNAQGEIVGLNLRDSQISDISFLQGLTQLQTLHLSFNRIRDISFLQDLRQLQTLYLGGNQIQDISFLQGLTQLQSLNLSYNQIQDYSVLQGLTQLKTLFLGSNQIQDYSFLQGLTQLQTLNLSYNQIQDISFLKGLTQLQSLNLSYNQIQDYSFLQGLTQLQTLYLSDNQIQDISFLKGLTQLKTLNLSQNQIQDYSFLQGLTQLQTLDLEHNQIQDYSFLQGLTQLQTLNLRGNPIQDYSFLQGLTQLQTLNLEHNQIQDYSFLQGLTQLQTLDLRANQIQDISFLQGLTQLKTLYLSLNQIQDISFLQGLTQLKTLNLSSNQIQDISFLKGLTQLQTLNLSSNRIQDISFLQGLTQLHELNLSSNQIQDISFLQGLTQLHELNLSTNRIQDISFLQGLTQLQNLNLERNQITELSLAFLKAFPNSMELYLYRNPIQNIPKEIFDKDGNVLKEVRNYLEDIEKQEGIANREVKIVFIGNGRVGKTQIAKKLAAKREKRKLDSLVEFLEKTFKTTFIKNKPYFVLDTEHHSTHGIALLRRGLAGFELNCWDFAGQDLYHATHRLFLQTRALMVLVWDFENENLDFHEWKGKRYENEKLLYWLEYARCFAPESPVLVLQNKIDAFPQDLYFEKKEAYKNEYPILDFLKVSAETGEGFMLLEKKLKDIFSTHKAFQTPPLPTNWVAVRNVIREKQENRTQKTLSFAEFEDICKQKNCENSASTILSYLHDTGVLYYQERYFNNQIILNQDWAIQAIYRILDRESAYFDILKDQKGILTYENLCEIWTENTDQERALFMDFMLSAELAFETTENKNWDTPLQERTFAVPQLLPAEKTDNDVKTWEHKNAAILQKTEISYRFLPKVFIQRFIVKASRFSDVKLIWQKGLLFKTAQGEAIVEACYEGQPKITILANEFLAQKIKEELSKIANEGKLRGKEGTESPEEKFGLAGLNPIFIKTYTPMDKKKIKIFVSYSSADQVLRELLVEGIERHLKHRPGFEYELWTDKQIDGGANWQEEIQKAIQKSDAALLLVSSNFVASKYIEQQELAKFFKRQQENNYLILPILVRDYEFQGFEELSKLQFFKSYFPDYGFNRPIERNQMMYFSKLAENENTTDDQLNTYYKKVAEFIHTAVANRFKLN